MSYYNDNGNSFLNKLATAAMMAALLGIGWGLVHGWRWLVAHWPE